MTDAIEDAATPEAMPPAMPWTPPAGPVAMSEAKIAEIKALAEKADQLVEASLSANTRLACGKAWRAWSEWCLGFGLDPTGENPSAAADARWLVMHLTALSEKRSLSTILLRRAAVVAIRKRLKRPLALDDAEFEAFLKGLRRTKGARPVRKAALLEPNLRAPSLVLTPEMRPPLADLDLPSGASPPEWGDNMGRAENRAKGSSQERPCACTSELCQTFMKRRAPVLERAPELVPRDASTASELARAGRVPAGRH
ncbi:hypothetical protein AB4Z01_05485 [Inquilinus sp. YAF38]|uniref:hypothetical protein n=1 Tax=Inquilinus sp. YAF38 TaxID=3233084 RepID=UPI003F91BAD1